MEIERKFLMSGFPDMPYDNWCLYSQGYLSINPEIRIRTKTKNDITTYRLCCKSGGHLSREEREFDLNEKEFSALLAYIPYKLINKVIFNYNLPNGLTLTVCHVDPSYDNAFYYAEIEFETEQEAMDYVPTFDFIEEVTYNSYYKMKNYWQRTRVENLENINEI